ncbi:class I SAM-dependent methyltransferase [Saccharibacillus alkalitolerans]|uniref:Small RNA 2'-O-methyltransferase n=1 Tax=Saccharibacillus alkalitolerans TaxID=2705290 RepID=A0ABX0F6E1_9BACL|nr:class I SAM-dependent methyltransferase [Saccharibacillus alkalitolerans]NGZ75168.1 methyltransferase domain-containing protein [Saccharibacillus alkalitolerans]
MAIIQLSSTHPDFTFLIRKNPETGMLIRPVRKGLAYGWYSDPRTFNVYFKDADNEVSYKRSEQEEFEYLNVSRYNTPLFPLGAINEFFSHPLKPDERDTAGHTHTLFVNMIHVERDRYIDFFAKHLPDISFELEHLAHKSYSLKMTTDRNLYVLLHAASVLFLFLSMFGKEFLDLTDAVLEKYIRSVNIIDAPFYIRSLFVRNFLNSRARFRKYAGELERTDRCEIRFDFGGTAYQRRSAITELLAFDKSILDIGCGEGFYAVPYAERIKDDHGYYAVDVNEEALAQTASKAQRKELENLIPFSSLEHFLESYGGERVDVILTEVVEHMGKEEAASLVRRVLDDVDFERFVITTPNADFNAYYELEGLRHEDHDWEMGRREFRAWISALAEVRGLDTQWLEIGDRVNGTATTQGVRFIAKDRYALTGTGGAAHDGMEP